MKKLKILALLAMMLIAATLLCACGGFANLNKVFNKAFDTSAQLYTKAEELSDLEKFSLVSGATDDFAVFTKQVDGYDAYKIYNFRTEKIVETYTNDKNTTYKISLLLGAPAYCVEKESGGKTSKEYYDAAGNKFAEVEDVAKEINGCNVVNNKLVIINAVAYEIDQADGTIKEKKSVPAYVSYNGITTANDEYFYALGNTIIVYDIDFEPVATWIAPSYAQGLRSFVLNNGAVLVQYSVVLDEDAKKFDYYANGNKFDLVSLVLSTKGDVKDVKLDYLVNTINTNYELYDEDLEKEENKYTNKFENIAIISRIENKLIDTEINNRDIVLMNNSGKAQKSLKMVDGQKVSVANGVIVLPEKISENLFVVDTVYGEAIVNAKGKVEFAVTEGNIKYFGGYIIVEGRAIYNLDFEVVYDLIDKDAQIFDSDNDATNGCDGYAGDTVFVKVGEDTSKEYEILAFVAGSDEPQSIMKWDITLTNNKTFKIEKALGGYSIEDPAADKKYTYYAADTTELISVDEALTLVADGNNGKTAIFKAPSAEKYYVFTKGEEKK